MEKKNCSTLSMVIAYVIVAILVAPCLLAVSCGLDGEPTVWNFVGIAYIAAWVIYLKKYHG